MGPPHFTLKVQRPPGMEHHPPDWCLHAFGMRAHIPNSNLLIVPALYNSFTPVSSRLMVSASANTSCGLRR